MKIFLDLDPSAGVVRNAIEQIFTTVGELEFVPTLQEADGIITDEPAKAEVYLDRTDKRVAQLLWWKQKPSTRSVSDRFRIFDILPSTNRGSLPGIAEAIAFLKGK